ncbi:thermolabile hemolysin [Luteibacter sp. OK325]|uniref:SGNH/GDSL hydrolase family protein n=1 Tax=Luteibacter sp. OK325 TaxID=2135670 RepID=UPI000D3D5271|nr:SGNH/GDSL hydrolase family protein [Luteibacter sp. OK325]PTR27337.1 thermolabile hemolysin [Luteibacter sp. OK325]
MSPIGRAFAYAASCALAGFALVSHAAPSASAVQGGPFSEINTGVRCHYRLKSDPTGVATGFVAADHILRGQWHNASILKSRSMFFTDAAPATLRAACMKKISTVPDSNGLAMIGAADNAQSYNYEIWYNGDLAKGKPIERIVSFGDSLSDTGNMFNESQWKLPGASWYLGRFSNGPTWIEHLAARTGLALNNWAIGGAQTKDAKFGIIHGVGRQIDGFFNYAAKAKGYDPSRTLFTFLISGNDFVNDTKTAPKIVEDQELALRRLVDHGARKILVVNLPDISVAPVFRLGRTDAGTILGKVEYYNHHIAQVVERVNATTPAEVRLVNARAYFDDVLKAPGRFGIANTKDSCLAIDSPSSTSYIKAQKRRPDCTDPSKYVFWDTLHPTTRVHELMAQWAIEAAPVAWGLRK